MALRPIFLGALWTCRGTEKVWDLNSADANGSWTAITNRLKELKFSQTKASNTSIGFPMGCGGTKTNLLCAVDLLAACKELTLLPARD